MGLFDSLVCLDPEFVCSEGHTLAGQEFQTYDLGRTMGWGVIQDGVLTWKRGGWGDPVDVPVTGTLHIGCECHQCPAFVQAGTGNLVPFGAQFDVEVKEDKVVSVRRTGEIVDEDGFPLVYTTHREARQEAKCWGLAQYTTVRLVPEKAARLRAREGR